MSTNESNDQNDEQRPEWKRWPHRWEDVTALAFKAQFPLSVEEATKRYEELKEALTRGNRQLSPSDRHLLNIYRWNVNLAMLSKLDEMTEGLVDGLREENARLKAENARAINALLVLLQTELDRRDAARADEDWAAADDVNDRLDRAGIYVLSTNGPLWGFKAEGDQ